MCTVLFGGDRRQGAKGGGGGRRGLASKWLSNKQIFNDNEWWIYRQLSAASRLFSPVYREFIAALFILPLRGGEALTPVQHHFSFIRVAWQRR